MTPFENKAWRRLSITNVAPDKPTGSARIGLEDFARLTTAAQQSCSPNISAVL
jgi:hypothetical protein